MASGLAIKVTCLSYFCASESLAREMQASHRSLAVRGFRERRVSMFLDFRVPVKRGRVALKSEKTLAIGRDRRSGVCIY